MMGMLHSGRKSGTRQFQPGTLHPEAKESGTLLVKTVQKTAAKGAVIPTASPRKPPLLTDGEVGVLLSR